MNGQAMVTRHLKKAFIRKNRPTQTGKKEYRKKCKEKKISQGQNTHNLVSVEEMEKLLHLRSKNEEEEQLEAKNFW